MSDNRIEGYARALFEIARAEGTIDEVEDELFRLARTLIQRRSAQRSHRREDPGGSSPGNRRGPVGR